MGSCRPAKVSSGCDGKPMKDGARGRYDQIVFLKGHPGGNMRNRF